MPPVRTTPGRASKACDTCRARKQRCYESGESTRTCLRCSTLRLECSLQRNKSQRLEPSEQHSCAAMEARLHQLERTVEKLSNTIQQSQAEDGIRATASNGDNQGNRHEAPLGVIRDAARETDLASNRSISGTEPPLEHDRQTIVSKQILGKDDVQLLLNIFERHYGRWIAISENDSNALMFENIGSALLLCSCCLIAVRHSSKENVSRSASTLFAEARNLLGTHVLNSTQPIEFFQAVVLLSLWPTTAGGKILSMDPWLLTSFGLQHAIISNSFESIPRTIAIDESRDLQIWNHLCLAHLHSCVSMRRKAMITRNDLDRGRRIAEWNTASNFEVRMVAEMFLYWTIYEQCVGAVVDLRKAQTALQSWRAEWKSLFDQPRSQFLQMSFYFAELMMYEQSLSKKSAAVRESLLSEMFRLSFELLSTAMDSNDERTKYLTDHIYHMIAFAAVTLIRLLYKYETQLKTRHDMEKADALVSATVHWLQGVDMSSHIGYMMGNLIKAVQQKLRPQTEESTLHEPEFSQLQAEDLIIPDFLGMDSVDFDWDAMIPDWQSLASEELLSPVNAIGT